MISKPVDILSFLISNKLNEQRIYNELAQVVSVDEDNMTCEVSFVNTNATKIIRLGTRITTDDTAGDINSVFVIPAVDSYVLVGFVNQTTGYISLYSIIDKVKYKINNSTIEMIDGTIEYKVDDGTTSFIKIIDGVIELDVNGTYIKINDGNIEIFGTDDNMVRFSELKTGFDQFKSDFNTFINSIFNSHTHICAAPGAPSAPPVAPGTPTSASIDASKIDEITTL